MCSELTASAEHFQGLNRINSMNLLPAPAASERWLAYCRHRTNNELFSNLARLDAGEAQALAVVLAHLAELDERRAAAETSHASLFNYCTRVLGYSEAEAFLRIRAARQAKRFPSILSMIAARRIHVTALAKLAPHLTPENYRRLLDRASRRTMRELDAMIAELAPMPEPRPVIRTLSSGVAAVPAAPPEAGLALFEGSPPPSVAAPATSLEPPGPARPAERPSGRPVRRSGRVLFKFTVDEAVRADYERAREVLRHKFPAGCPEQIFAAALDALLERRDPERRLRRKERRLARLKAARWMRPAL